MLGVLWEKSRNPPGTQVQDVDWGSPEMRIDRKTGVGIEEPVAEVSLVFRGLVDSYIEENFGKIDTL